MRVYVNEVVGGTVVSIVSGREVIFTRNYFDWTSAQVWDMIEIDWEGPDNYAEGMINPFG